MTNVSVDSLRELLRGFRQKYGVPAVGGAVVTRDGVRVDVVGTRRRDLHKKAAVDDQWHIGSCGKSIAAVVYARLVERGVAEWGMPIAAFLPDLSDRIAPPWRERTVDGLFVCQAGMKANPSVAEMKASWESTAPLVEQRTGIATTALSKPPRRRGRFVYSNLSYVVIGAAVDRIAGRSFEDVLETDVYKPLGITSGGVGPPPKIWGHKYRWRTGNLCLGRGKPLDPEDRHSDNPPILTSAGRLHLTLADWALFHRIFLTGESGFLKPETIDHLLTAPNGGPMAMGWGAASGRDNIANGMQGSNTFWSATALLHRNREQMALVACNDGRMRVLHASAKLAIDILESA